MQVYQIMATRQHCFLLCSCGTNNWIENVECISHHCMWIPTNEKTFFSGMQSSIRFTVQAKTCAYYCAPFLLNIMVCIFLCWWGQPFLWHYATSSRKYCDKLTQSCDVSILVSFSFFTWFNLNCSIKANPTSTKKTSQKHVPCDGLKGCPEIHSHSNMMHASRRNLHQCLLHGLITEIAAGDWQPE